jgi:hypothetical protein
LWQQQVYQQQAHGNDELIDVHCMKVEAGRVAKPIFRGKKTELPCGIRQGHINFINMEGGWLPSCPLLKNDTGSFRGEYSSDVSSKFPQGYEPVLPVIGKYLLSVNLGRLHCAVGS